MLKYIVLFILLAMNLFAKSFTIGTTSGYAPFVSLDEKGEYEGFDIDIAKEVSRKLDRPLIIRDYGSMPSLMLALKQKKVDALIWGISITKDREKSMEMVYYQGDKLDKVPLIFWDNIPNKTETLSDLATLKKPICVEAGSYQEGIFKTCPNLSLKYFDGIDSVILDLKYGKSGASAIDPSLLPRFQAKYPNLKVLFLPLPEEMQSLGNGICINQDDQELALKIKKAIEELRDEGVIFKLEKKWGLRK